MYIQAGTVRMMQCYRLVNLQVGTVRMMCYQLIMIGINAPWDLRSTSDSSNIKIDVLLRSRYRVDQQFFF